jgi:hypothetical protein
LEMSMNDTNYLISSQHLPFRINTLCWYLCHSDLFRSQTELKVIGHHHIHMPDPNSKSSDSLSDGPVEDILRPEGGPRCTILTSLPEKTRKTNHLLMWCQCKGSSFSSIVLRPWVEVRARIEPESPSLKGKRADHDTTSAG